MPGRQELDLGAGEITLEGRRAGCGKISSFSPQVASNGTWLVRKYSWNFG
ncbi:MAG TPA: hypothetical protein VGD71_39760 [Kribbella sp.]|jgi:hypothetical protein